MSSPALHYRNGIGSSLTVSNCAEIACTSSALNQWDTSPNLPLRKFGEEALDPVKPSGAHRSEMNIVVQTPGEPIVHRLHLDLDVILELAELRMPRGRQHCLITMTVATSSKADRAAARSSRT